MEPILPGGSTGTDSGIFEQSLPLGEVIRDIQLPEAVPLWPLAPGWWGLLLLLLVALSIALFFWYRQGRLRRAALAELDTLLRLHGGQGSQADLVMGVSTLLRRVALAQEPRQQVAGLVGSDWLAYLDARGATTAFSAGPGRVLVSLPYGGEEEIDIEALHSLVRCWIMVNT